MTSFIAARSPAANVLMVISLFLTVFQYVIIIQALLSFFARGSRVYWFLHRVTEPLVRLFRPLTQRFVSARFPFDLAPLLAYFLIMIINSFLRQVMYVL